MKFEKVSLEQFTEDYLRCKGFHDDVDLDEETAKEIIKIYSDIQLPKRGTKFSAGYDFFMPY